LALLHLKNLLKKLLMTLNQAGNSGIKKLCPDEVFIVACAILVNLNFTIAANGHYHAK
jgi:hypothetical protein